MFQNKAYLSCTCQFLHKVRGIWHVQLHTDSLKDMSENAWASSSSWSTVMFLVWSDTLNLRYTRGDVHELYLCKPWYAISYFSSQKSSPLAAEKALYGENTFKPEVSHGSMFTGGVLHWQCLIKTTAALCSKRKAKHPADLMKELDYFYYFHSSFAAPFFYALSI